MGHVPVGGEASVGQSQHIVGERRAFRKILAASQATSSRWSILSMSRGLAASREECFPLEAAQRYRQAVDGAHRRGTGRIFDEDRRLDAFFAQERCK